MGDSVGDAVRALVGPATWTGLGVDARRVRDLVLVDVGDRTIVIACDSNASTGDKPADFLQQDPVITGYSAAKVPLMEVLATGASPFLLVNNLCCDLATTGISLLRGIRKLLDETNINLMVTGSDESNMPTTQTGIGVTVIGIAEPASLRLGRVTPGDEIWVVGRRRSGVGEDDYAEGDPATATAIDVKGCLALPAVHEILPVGSHGIAYECEELARVGGVRIRTRTGTQTDLHLSAGASTCFLVAAEPGAFAQLETLDRPVELIGHALPLDL